MSQPELLKRVVAVLEKAGIEYMVTGSIASSAYGAPRLTHDVDLVLDLSPAGLKPLIEAFPSPEFYFSEEAALDAIRGRSMFNLLWMDTGVKMDFWLVTQTPFDQSRFARKRVIEALGLRFSIASPEDMILVKLRWCQESGGSEKQFVDALRVYEVQHRILDLEYLEHWARELHVEELWQRLKTEARPL
jgi:hypothetical protein